MFLLRWCEAGVLGLCPCLLQPDVFVEARDSSGDSGLCVKGETCQAKTFLLCAAGGQSEPQQP